MTCTYGGGSCGPTVTTTPTTVTTVAVPHSSSQLPFTGGDVLGLGFLGVGALVVGSFLARTRRRTVA